MMRSMAASMKSSVNSNQFGGLEFRDRLVGEPEPVHFAALEQPHDDLQQPFVGGEGVGNGAGAAQVIRCDGIGIADRLDIHHPQSALDQHGPVLRFGGISTVVGKSSIPEPGFWRGASSHLKTPSKAKRTGPENRTDALR